MALDPGKMGDGVQFSGETNTMNYDTQQMGPDEKWTNNQTTDYRVPRLHLNTN